MKMIKNVITGSAGFIGSHLVEALTKRGDEVIGYDNLSRGEESSRNVLDTKPEPGLYKLVVGDVLDLAKVKTVIKDGVDVVYHMAALPSHRLALERPYDFSTIDIMGTLNVLEAARLCNPKPLVVFASSNKVYGKQECPWSEKKLPKPEGPYAVAKYSSEKLCEMYNKYFDVPIVIIRYHHVAGPRSNPDLALSVFTEKALKGEIIEIHGKFIGHSFESCSADYTHIDDAVRATLLAANKYKGFDIFNVANENLTTVEYIAKQVIKKLKSNSKITHVDMWPHETLVHHSDVSRAEERLGFKAKIPVEKAIQDYIKWKTK